MISQVDLTAHDFGPAREGEEVKERQVEASFAAASLLSRVSQLCAHCLGYLHYKWENRRLDAELMQAYWACRLCPAELRTWIAQHTNSNQLIRRWVMSSEEERAVIAELVAIYSDNAETLGSILNGAHQDLGGLLTAPP